MHHFSYCDFEHVQMTKAQGQDIFTGNLLSKFSF